jgi:hypothetical protein
MICLRQAQDGVEIVVVLFAHDAHARESGQVSIENKNK